LGVGGSTPVPSGKRKSHGLLLSPCEGGKKKKGRSVEGGKGREKERKKFGDSPSPRGPPARNGGGSRSIRIRKKKKKKCKNMHQEKRRDGDECLLCIAMRGEETMPVLSEKKEKKKKRKNSEKKKKNGREERPATLISCRRGKKKEREGKHSGPPSFMRWQSEKKERVERSQEEGQGELARGEEALLYGGKREKPKRKHRQGTRVRSVNCAERGRKEGGRLLRGAEKKKKGGGGGQTKTIGKISHPSPPAEEKRGEKRKKPLKRGREKWYSYLPEEGEG